MTECATDHGGKSCVHIREESLKSPAEILCSGCGEVQSLLDYQTVHPGDVMTAPTRESERREIKDWVRAFVAEHRACHNLT